MRGRPPRPTAELIADGSYRADRHGHRADVQFAGDKPDEPEGLGEYGGQLWRDYFACAPPDLLIQIDSACLEDACRTWERISQYQRILSADPLELKVAAALIQAQRVFLNYSARLGLSPVDRARLKAPPKPKQDDNPLTRLRAARIS
jgi:phage terminase small subunit